jgi:D-beta-D-heptose 7-phosphate kinase/D-beta-D-heptose 1-phosphate adenosyltransferase
MRPRQALPLLLLLLALPAPAGEPAVKLPAEVRVRPGRLTLLKAEHAGHAAHLEEAARLGDVLVVAVNDDASVRRLKGENRPVIGAGDRAALVAALGCVGHVLIFHGDTPHEVLRRLRPDVLAKGGDYTPEQVVGREVVEGYGGRVCLTGRRQGLSTTQVLGAVLRGSRPGLED